MTREILQCLGLQNELLSVHIQNIHLYLESYQVKLDTWFQF